MVARFQAKKGIDTVRVQRDISKITSYINIEDRLKFARRKCIKYTRTRLRARVFVCTRPYIVLYYIQFPFFVPI